MQVDNCYFALTSLCIFPKLDTIECFAGERSHAIIVICGSGCCRDCVPDFPDPIRRRRRKANA